MAYLKQTDVKTKTRAKKTREVAPVAAVAPVSRDVRADGLGGIECALDNLAGRIGDFARNAYSGENKLQVFTGPDGSGFHPVLIALEPTDILEEFLEIGQRIATAFERIADALTKP
jgi:hypothetical protein